MDNAAIAIENKDYQKLTHLIQLIIERRTIPELGGYSRDEYNKLRKLTHGVIINEDGKALQILLEYFPQR